MPVSESVARPCGSVYVNVRARASRELGVAGGAEVELTDERTLAGGGGGGVAFGAGAG